MIEPVAHVTLHDYATDPTLPQKDGVNLAHENIGTLLRAANCDGFRVRFHDFNRLLRDEAYARKVLSHTRCVVSNVGPHAHYYFHLREKLGLDFRIVRDVRTAIWSSYLLQEHLCRPYLRPHDVLLVASHYTRGLYEKMFPHLRTLPTVRCYPLTVGFPPEVGRWQEPTGKKQGVVTLGYVGRLSEDKNFPDIIELLITLNRRHPGRYRLLACGDIHSPSCHPDKVCARLVAMLGTADSFDYLPSRGNAEIWALYRQFDVMVFPSTSNLETLGRVLIEASYAGVPVVCGEHAAAAELMPPSSLCRVHYGRNQSFSAHYDHSLGHVDIDDMVRAVTHPGLGASDCHLDYQQHPDRFIGLLIGEGIAACRMPETLELTPSQQSLIDAIEVTLPPALNDIDQASRSIAHLIPWFLGLQAKDSTEREQWLAKLRMLSGHPERTLRFIEKSAATRCDFTNVGGIDIELCHAADFYPAFTL